MPRLCELSDLPSPTLSPGSRVQCSSRHNGVGEEGCRKEIEGLVLTLQGHFHGNRKGGGGGGGKGHSFSERPGPNWGSCPVSCVQDAAAFFVLCE